MFAPHRRLLALARNFYYKLERAGLRFPLGVESQPPETRSPPFDKSIRSVLDLASESLFRQKWHGRAYYLRRLFTASQLLASRTTPPLQLAEICWRAGLALPATCLILPCTCSLSECCTIHAAYRLLNRITNRQSCVPACSHHAAASRLTRIY